MSPWLNSEKRNIKNEHFLLTQWVNKSNKWIQINQWTETSCTTSNTREFTLENCYCAILFERTPILRRHWTMKKELEVSKETSDMLSRTRFGFMDGYKPPVGLPCRTLQSKHYNLRSLQILFWVHVHHFIPGSLPKLNFLKSNSLSQNKDNFKITNKNPQIKQVV